MIESSACQDTIHFLHDSKWTEQIVRKFEKYIHSEPDECCHIAELALTSGVVEWWKDDGENPFSLMAWLLTNDNFNLKENCHQKTFEYFKQKFHELVDGSDFSRALKTSIYIAHQIRNDLFLHKKNTLFVQWKKAINDKIVSYKINYINLQGANLKNADLSHLKLPANLRNANLKETDLSNTDLRGAYLRGATVTKKQLNNAIINHTTELPY